MRNTAISACLLTAAASFALVLPAQTAQAYVSTKIDYGFPHGEVDEVEDAGADLLYGSHWAVGGDITGVDDAILSNQGNGTVPLIHWYYWGATVDDYGSNGVPCVDNWSVVSGCDGKSREQWESKAQQLATLIENMQGSNRTVVSLELEFHQGPTASGSTAENMDGYLERQANFFRAKTNIKTALGFGEWASNSTYDIYNRAQAASDYAGTQILWSCYQQTRAKYLSGPSRVRDNAAALQAKFPTKPVFIYDFGLSSYSGALSNDPSYNSSYECREPDNYETHQKTAYRELVSSTMRQALKDRGVIAVVFREYYDEPNRPNWTGDHHKLAEKYWGIVDQRPEPDRRKPSYDDVIAGINAESGGGGCGNDCGGGGVDEWKQEAELFTSRPVGGLGTDTSASGGQYWNVWSDGTISTTMTAATSGVKRVVVKAKGDPAAGVWPHMLVKVNGTTVSDVTVGTDTWQAYGAALYLGAGTHTVAVTFDNDGNVSGDDRNLLVDFATLNPASESWRQEAEAFPTRTAGGSITSSGASGGAYWNLWSNGHIETTMTVPYTSAHEIDVVARGDVAGGVWPIMKVYVGGTLIATQTVDQTSWTTYRFRRTMSGGSRTLRIEFTNDGIVGSEDRNLKVDYAALYS